MKTLKKIKIIKMKYQTTKITNNKGELEYIVDKGEDFLTIVINKMGFFPIQRTFIRDKNMVINEEDQYYEEMSFFLVKKNFVYNTKCILILTNLKVISIF